MPWQKYLKYRIKREGSYLGGCCEGFEVVWEEEGRSKTLAGWLAAPQ